MVQESDGHPNELSTEVSRQDSSWLVSNTNVGDTERLLSTLSGVGLAMYGLSRMSWRGLGFAALGSYLTYRGVSGHCKAYEAVGVSTTTARPEGILVDTSIAIDLSRDELYRFWLDFENLPQFMDHLEAVWMIGDHRYHWVARAPAGMSVEWDADVIREQYPEVIAWRSRAGADVPNEGTVRFESEPEGDSTVVHVSLRYYPPAGRIGAWIAKLFGEEPGMQIEQDLKHFKELMETGSRPITGGRSSDWS